MITFRATIHLLGTFLLVALAARGQDATDIFKKLEPSVVSISDAEGVGSGVVLTEDGMILTNYHVASSPLPKTVEALVQENGQKVRKTFGDAKLVKAHKTSDLALVKVDSNGVRFIPAKLSKNDGDIQAGATCYVIGFPYIPDQEKPIISISRGIINTTNRMLAGNPYIQLDAAINPGNSGGALVSSKGLVIGVPTLRIEGADSIGMAAPVTSLKMEQFIDPREKKGDAKEAGRLANLADRIYLNDILSLRMDDDVVHIAAMLQRQAVAADPNNPEWFYGLAKLYFRLREYELAKAYSECVVKMAPENLMARLQLASTLLALNKGAEAVTHKLHCLSLMGQFQNQEQRNEFLSTFAKELSDVGDHARSIYLVSWGRSLTGGNQLTASQRLAAQVASTAIALPVIDEIMRKTDDFSVNDMNRFLEKANASKPNVARDEMDISKNHVPSGAAIEPTAFSSVMNFPAGVDAQLKDAPTGVTYDAASRKLTWIPIPFSKMQKARVLFELKHPDGKEEYMVHIISKN